jgi:hypothetical protein
MIMKWFHATLLSVGTASDLIHCFLSSCFVCSTITVYHCSHAVSLLTICHFCRKLFDAQPYQKQPCFGTTCGIAWNLKDLGFLCTLHLVIPKIKGSDDEILCHFLHSNSTGSLVIKILDNWSRHAYSCFAYTILTYNIEFKSEILFLFLLLVTALVPEAFNLYD